MFKKKQVLSLISIAVISLLIGTALNVMTMATDGGNPFDNIWEAIDELNQTVKSLNQTIEELRTQIPKKLKVMTTTDLMDTWLELGYYKGDFYELFTDVTIPEGTTVVAIGTLSAQLCASDAWMELRHRTNNSYSETRVLRYINSPEPMLIEIHHPWINLTAGTYTFALECKTTGVQSQFISSVRLTLVIIP
ncbi:MAG: hypothetical protein E3J73_01205 [Candidatus Bathyarchaeum sp.]|nr:MAG: hypothetical protein E3J73_01205 [Candidatus Bathyarchaeum sp.]